MARIGIPTAAWSAVTLLRRKRSTRFCVLGMIAAVTMTAPSALAAPVDPMPDLPPGGSDPPVIVNDAHHYWSVQSGATVVLPEGSLADSQLSELNSIEHVGTAQADWLVEHGAVANETVWISIAVSGNRTDGVRIVDVRPIQKCSDPYAGALFLYPPQGSETSLRLNFDLDQTNPTPTYRNESGNVVSYFPDNTVSLKKGEQQVLTVAATTRKHACSFTLEMTILDGNRRVKQLVSDHNGEPFRVSALITRPEGGVAVSAYKEVFYNTVICAPDRGYVRVPKSFSGRGCP